MSGTGEGGDDNIVRCDCGAEWTRERIAAHLGVRTEQLPPTRELTLHQCSECAGRRPNSDVEMADASRSMDDAARLIDEAIAEFKHAGKLAVRLGARDALVLGAIGAVASNFGLNLADNPRASWVDLLFTPNKRVVRRVKQVMDGAVDDAKRRAAAEIVGATRGIKVKVPVVRPARKSRPKG